MKKWPKQLGKLSKISAFVAVFSLGVVSSMADAQERHVEVVAQTEHEGVYPGESGLLAVTFKVDKDWHIYWPGISDSGYGVTLNIQTTGPITLEEPVWPTPTRYIQPGEILDHIYEDGAMVLIPFKVDEDAATDDAIFFDIETDFLVCKDICLPGQASSSTTITILDSSSEKIASSASKEIRELYEHRPIPFDPKAEDVRLQWASNGAAIMFRDATKFEFFPSKECTELSNPIEDASVNGNRMVIKFAETENKVLSGRVRVYQLGSTVEYDINVRQPE
ncbi:MAG: protein-disulfide reductase DsbD family protein [Phycisphaerales bacterium]|nr:protein-disulfide reductase DsbD family protein [Phycisphaerales bacterium]